MKKIKKAKKENKKYTRQKLPKAIDPMYNKKLPIKKLEPKKRYTSVDNKVNDAKPNETKKEEKKKQVNIIEEKKKSKGNKVYIVSFILICFILLIFSCCFSIYFKYISTNTIIPGVFLENVDFSNKTYDEAKKELEDIYLQKTLVPFEIAYDENVLSINPEAISLSFDIDKTLDNLIGIGRDDNLFVSNYNIVKTYFKKDNISVEYSYDQEQIIGLLTQFSQSLPGYKIDPTYVVDNSKLIINSGVAGITADTNDVIQKLNTKIKETSLIEKIDVNVIEAQPLPIDIDKIHEEVYKEAKDAYYTKEPFEIYQEVIGVDFDVAAAKEMIATPQESYTIALNLTYPAKTVDEIGSEAFPDRLGTCTTNFNAGDVSRTQNLRIACQKINGKVLMPGETFSYNQTLGERTIANGYRYGKVFENGKVVDGIGGGICQISSTLYNAVLKANLDIVERRNHSFVTSYIKAGLDATVVYGSIDFRFTNTRKYPVRIVASLNGSSATVSIFGNKEDVEYDISFSSTQLSTIPYTTVYEDDPTQPAGTETVVQAGSSGSVWQTYMIKSLNGQVVENKFLSKDTYSPMQRIVKKGSQ